jgi:hypothetical protein
MTRQQLHLLFRKYVSYVIYTDLQMWCICFLQWLSIIVSTRKVAKLFWRSVDGQMQAISYQYTYWVWGTNHSLQLSMQSLFTGENLHFHHSIAIVKDQSWRNYDQIEMRKCLLSFGAESFFFNFRIQKYQDQDKQNYNFAYYFVWVCNLVAHNAGGT